MGRLSPARRSIKQQGSAALAPLAGQLIESRPSRDQDRGAGRTARLDVGMGSRRVGQRMALVDLDLDDTLADHVGQGDGYCWISTLLTRRTNNWRTQRTNYSAGKAFRSCAPSLYSPHACRRICTEEVRKIPAMSAATARSGHAVDVPQTPRAAAITITLPMASLREQSQTERTFASPSLYGIKRPTEARLAASAKKPMIPMTSALGTPRNSV